MEITDPKAIRALAHAARLEVISELYSTQVSRTATELAAQTGLTPSAMSYHLRALQKWGIVVPAATAGDARERRWKAAGTDFTIHSLGGVASPELAVLDLELEAYRRRVLAYAKTRNERRQGGDTTDGPSSVVLASNLLYLTPDQRAELTRSGLRPPAGLRAGGSGPRARGCRAHGHHVVDDSGRSRPSRRETRRRQGLGPGPAPRAAGSGTAVRTAGRRALVRPEPASAAPSFPAGCAGFCKIW